MRICNLKDPIYDFKLNLVCQCTYEEFRQFVLERDSYECGQYRDNTIGMYVPIEQKNVYYLFIPDAKNVPVIAHETLHLVLDILNSKGLELNKGSEEAYTYSFEFWIRLILSKLN